MKRPLDAVIHTLGWPLPTDAFGGSFMYPLGPTQVALGLVVGLDYHDARLDVHELLQRMKLHPLFRRRLEGGQLLEWGAKTIPEGGYYALPERRSGDGVLFVGDTVGVRGRAVAQGHSLRDAVGHVRGPRGVRRAQGRRRVRRRARRLRPHGERELHRRRYAPDAEHAARIQGRAVRRWHQGRAHDPDRRALSRRTDRDGGGRDDAAHTAARELASLHARRHADVRQARRGVQVGQRDARHDPVALLVGRDVTAEVAEFYSHVCPAGVYERAGDELRVNAPNCVDCKATDVLGPRWTPREGGSGPKYRSM